jgi:CDP-diacylglycerol--glycerol-3-phosphate 3-phosphatidyltransferase
MSKSSHRQYDRILTIPNLLSGIRVLMALLAALLFFFRGPTLFPALLCTVAALLDTLDGYIARRANQISRLGEHLDPLADKILISVIFLALAHFSGSLLAWVFVLLLLVREWGITWLRERYQRKTGLSLPADRLGKWKMLLQSILGNGLLILLGLGASAKSPTFTLLLLLSLILILVLASISAFRYFGAMRSTVE